MGAPVGVLFKTSVNSLNLRGRDLSVGFDHCVDVWEAIRCDGCPIARMATNDGFVDEKRQRREALSLLARHGVELDLGAAVGSLSWHGA